MRRRLTFDRWALPDASIAIVRCGFSGPSRIHSHLRGLGVHTTAPNSVSDTSSYPSRSFVARMLASIALRRLGDSPSDWVEASIEGVRYGDTAMTATLSISGFTRHRIRGELNTRPQRRSLSEAVKYLVYHDVLVYGDRVAPATSSTAPEHRCEDARSSPNGSRRGSAGSTPEVWSSVE